MPKIKCASCECKWNDNKNNCTYKGTLNIGDWNVHTVNMGFAHFHECKMYEEDEHTKALRENIMAFMKEKNE